MNRLAAFLLLLFVILSCNQNDETISKESNAIEQEIVALLEEYYVVMSGRNWTKYKEFFAPGGSLTTIWSDTVGQPPMIHTSTIHEFIASAGEGPDSQPIFEEKPIQIKVEVIGDIASAWVHYEAKFGTEQDLMEWKGYDLVSLIRHEEQWKIVSITFASDEED